MRSHKYTSYFRLGNRIRRNPIFLVDFPAAALYYLHYMSIGSIHV